VPYGVIPWKFGSNFQAAAGKISFASDMQMHPSDELGATVDKNITPHDVDRKTLFHAAAVGNPKTYGRHDVFSPL
jgi:hypothetical protein